MITTKKATSTADNRPNWNFLISSALNVYGTANHLPAEIIDYGLQTGRIQPQEVDAKPVPTKTGKPSKSKGQPVVLEVKETPEKISQVAGANVVFDTPQIDTDSIQW